MKSPPNAVNIFGVFTRGGGANGDLGKWMKNAHKCKKYDKTPDFALDFWCKYV